MLSSTTTSSNNRMMRTLCYCCMLLMVCMLSNRNKNLSVFGFTSSYTMQNKNHNFKKIGFALKRSLHTLSKNGMGMSLLHATKDEITETSTEEELAIMTIEKAQTFINDELLQQEEYKLHYHPYRDDDTKMKIAKTLLGDMTRLQSNCSTGSIMNFDICIANQEEINYINTELQSMITKYEKRVAKRKGSESVVPFIATELSLGALALVLIVFWTTLDMTQRHEVTPMNIQEFIGLVKEKGYIVSVLNM